MNPFATHAMARYRAEDLAGRKLTVDPSWLHANPRVPFTHGWLAFEVLRRAPGQTLAFEEYERRLFNPSAEIRDLAKQIAGVPDAYQDLKHIRCDIFRGAVLVTLSSRETGLMCSGVAEASGRALTADHLHGWL